MVTLCKINSFYRLYPESRFPEAVIDPGANKVLSGSSLSVRRSWIQIFDCVGCFFTIPALFSPPKYSIIDLKQWSF